MGKTATNLAVVLGLITVAFAAYYIYTQEGSSLVDDEQNRQTMQNMLQKTQAFIGYGQTLKTVDLDVNIFEDERFNSFRSYTTPIQERPIGRTDPFDDPVIIESNN